MCTMSMVGDHYMDIWKQVPYQPSSPTYVIGPGVTREEFDQLKRQVDEMVLLLKRAKKYDEDNGEPECELEEKMAVLRSVAKIVGVDLDAMLK